jgi:hypothetical protein
MALDHRSVEKCAERHDCGIDREFAVDARAERSKSDPGRIRHRQAKRQDPKAAQA